MHDDTLRRARAVHGWAAQVLDMARAVGGRAVGTPATAVDARDVDTAAIRAELMMLEDLMRQFEVTHADDIAAVHPDHHADAVNLVHYLALRQGDVRHLQRRLLERGLSSLGRCEPHVLATVQSVLFALDRQRPSAMPTTLSFEAGRSALDRNTDALFGPRPPGRVPRVMVTLPSEAADDYTMVRRFVAAGMDVARINGAHDDPASWERMAGHVRKTSADLDRRCRVSMDLPGPKIRTGPFVDGPQVVKLRPERDLRGVAVTPAVATLVGGEGNSFAAGLPVDRPWIERRRVGDVVDMVDTRGSQREWKVVETTPGQCRVEVWDTSYVETRAALSCDGDTTHVGALATVPQYHLLHAGDAVVLTRDLTPVAPWHHGQSGQARIGCTLAEAFGAATVGQRAIFDDGKLTGVIERVTADELHVRIRTASPRGSRLRAEKGINLPDTDLRVAAVSDLDLPLLEVAAAHADMVALSFLRTECDVDKVHEYLRRVRADHLGLILKIETVAAFGRLPEILLHAMRSPLVGVMIARGDLAVEAGYERLAEVQEEILWLCEAAHLPVIWATEVLDQLARAANRHARKSPTRPWLNAPNASCSTRDPISTPPSSCSTTSFAACPATNAKRLRSCDLSTAGPIPADTRLNGSARSRVRRGIGFSNKVLVLPLDQPDGPGQRASFRGPAPGGRPAVARATLENC